MRSLDKAQIFDAGSNPPIRRIVAQTAAGPVVEKITHSRHVKMVSPKGNVVRIVLAPGKSAPDQPRYEARTKEIRRRTGFIPYGECPRRTEALSDDEFPEELRQTLCSKQDGYGERKACPHVEYIIALRQKNATEADRIRAEARKPIEQRRLELEQKRLEALEAAAAEPKAKRKKATTE